jgi:hypothetical protein
MELLPGSKGMKGENTSKCRSECHLENKTFLWLSCHNCYGKNKQIQTNAREKCSVIKKQN